MTSAVLAVFEAVSFLCPHFSAVSSLVEHWAFFQNNSPRYFSISEAMFGGSFLVNTRYTFFGFVLGPC